MKTLDPCDSIDTGVFEATWAVNFAIVWVGACRHGQEGALALPWKCCRL